MPKKLSLTILTLTLTLLIIFPAKSTPTTTLYVDPETHYMAAVGQTFTINITVTNVTDLWGWEFKLFYNSAQLNGTAVEEGPFLKKAGETFFWIVNFTDNYNATHGYVYAFCILTYVIPGASGNGTLATITFKSKTYGSSVLDLTDTKIKNSEGDYIPHETYDGTVIVKKPGDANGDGIVNVTDSVILGLAWPPQPYNPICDFNNDGIINVIDSGILGIYWGDP